MTVGGSSDDLAAARYRAAADAADALTAAAEQAGLLIVLEDLQWADLTSLFLLGELAGNLTEGHGCSSWPPARDVAGGQWQDSLGDLARLPGLAAAATYGPLPEAADVTGILNAAGVSMDTDLAGSRPVPVGGQPALRHHAGQGPGGPVGPRSWMPNSAWRASWAAAPR